MTPKTTMKMLLPIRYAPIVILAMIVFGLIVLPSLPDQVPVHWGIDGQADRYADKWIGMLSMPAIAALLYVLAQLVGTRYDLSRDDNRLTYMFIVNVTITFLAVLHVATLGEALGWEIDVVRVITFGLGILFVLTGNIMGRLQPNAIFGYRTFWTLTDPEVWRRTHRVGARVMVVEGVLIGVLATVLPPEGAAIVVLAVVLPASLFMVGYSWWLWRARHA